MIENCANFGISYKYEVSSGAFFGNFFEKINFFENYAYFHEFRRILVKFRCMFINFHEI